MLLDEFKYWDQISKAMEMNESSGRCEEKRVGEDMCQG